MTERQAALKRIAVGDIFHACIRPDDGPSYICLALQVREDRIFARRMTIQSVHWFDRATGVEMYRENEDQWAEDPDWEPPQGSSRLTPDQRRALIFIADFYPAHPLPPRQ
jgi:hypothetical protein